MCKKNVNEITEIAVNCKDNNQYGLTERLLSEILIELKVMNIYNLAHETDMDTELLIEMLSTLKKVKDKQYQL